MTAPATRLGVFGLVLAGVFATAYGIGEAVPGHGHSAASESAASPVTGASSADAASSAGDSHQQHDTATTNAHATHGSNGAGAGVAGLSSLVDGHRVVVSSTIDTASTTASTSLSFRIERDGQPVAAFDDASGARRGILIKGPEVLESTRRIDTIVFAKTGTLTEGRMTVEQVIPAAEWSPDELLAVAAAVEAASEHPIARAIVDHQRAHSAEPLRPVEGFVAKPGLGAQGVVEGRFVALGRSNAGGLESARNLLERSGTTVVTARVDDVVAGIIALRDTVKPDALESMNRLVKLGIRPMLLSGDNASTAAAVGAQLGIAATDVRAEVLPDGKVAEIRRLQAEGRVVAMVGDGVNDAAALAQADLGIAMGAGTDVAIEASDLTIVRSDLGAVVDSVRLARRTLATIKGNLFWAFAYNVAAIPLAASGALSPTIAGAAMAFSSVFVVSNSLRLRRFT